MIDVLLPETEIMLIDGLTDYILGVDHGQDQEDYGVEWPLNKKHIKGNKND